MGYARTNIGNISQSGSGGGGNSTLPTVLKGISIAPGDSKLTVSWQYANTTYLKGIRVSWSTAGDINTPADSYSHIDINNTTTTSYTITGLTNNQRCYIRLFPYNNDKNYQTAITNATINGVPTSIVISGSVVSLSEYNGYTIAKIATSGSFNITVSASTNITAIILGGGTSGNTAAVSRPQYQTNYYGGNGGLGGRFVVKTITLSSGTTSCSATIGSSSSSQTTTSLICSGTTYSSTGGNYSGGGSGASNGSGKDTAPHAHSATNGASLMSSYVSLLGIPMGGGGGGGASDSASAYDSSSQTEYKVNYGGSGGAGAGNGGNYGQNGGDASGYGAGGGGAAIVTPTYANGYSETANVGRGSAGVVILYWPK